MKSEEIISELMMVGKYINNFSYISGTQVKMIVYHLIKTLDKVASYVIGEETILERDYLTLSKYRLFSDMELEDDFYNTYFYLKNLMDKSILRVSSEAVRIIGHKQTITADREFFTELISKVERISNDVASHASK